jgi:hypothetical protein
MLLRVLPLLFTLLFCTGCLKENEVYPTLVDYVTMDERDLMIPGPDPILRLDLSLVTGNIINATWERFMYVDRTDTIYNTSGGVKLAGYLKRYGFTGVYMYKTSTLLSSTSNYTGFSNFMKTLSDSGIVYRGIASGGSTTFGGDGNVTKFNSRQTDPSRKVNRANLELEWWNGACSWNTWNTTNKAVSQGTIIDNDFYEGWYKNLSSTIDTIAARDQVIYSDRILLHCYQNGIPTYSYANAQSSGATGGRLDIIAKGARQANKRIDLYIIISAENTAWGASNTFTGPALAAAANQPNPFQYIEQQAYNNIYGGMTAFQKQWINFKGFVWFTKRYCYRAIPPQ